MTILGFVASKFDKKTKFAIISPYHAYCPFFQLEQSQHATHFIALSVLDQKL